MNKPIEEVTQQGCTPTVEYRSGNWGPVGEYTGPTLTASEYMTLCKADYFVDNRERGKIRDVSFGGVMRATEYKRVSTAHSVQVAKNFLKALSEESSR